MATIHILGNVGQDPQRYEPKTEGGSVGVRFSVAENRQHKKSDQEVIKKTDWFNCFAFGPYAESMLKHLKKGTTVAIEAHAESHSWTDRESGKERSALQFRVVSYRPLSRNNDNDDMPMPTDDGYRVDDSFFDDDVPL